MTGTLSDAIRDRIHTCVADIFQLVAAEVTAAVTIPERPQHGEPPRDNDHAKDRNDHAR